MDDKKETPLPVRTAGKVKSQATDADPGFIAVWLSRQRQDSATMCRQAKEVRP
jgi:hypothetical protein